MPEKSSYPQLYNAETGQYESMGDSKSFFFNKDVAMSQGYNRYYSQSQGHFYAKSNALPPLSATEKVEVIEYGQGQSFANQSTNVYDPGQAPKDYKGPGSSTVGGGYINQPQNRIIAEKADSGKLNQTNSPDSVARTQSRGKGGYRSVDQSNILAQNKYGNRIRRDQLNLGFTFAYQHNKEQNFVTLFLNPEDFTQTEPPRITITQTKGGAYVDHFGQGLRQITMRGTTGYRYRDVGGTPVSGHTHFLSLRAMIRKWEDMCKIEGPEKNILKFYNWSDEEHYEIVITQFSLQRSNSRPLLYQYNIMFVCTKWIGADEKSLDDKYPWTKYLTSFDKRAPKIIKALDDELNKMEGWVNGTDDMSKYSKGTQDMAKNIHSGGTYFDNLAGMFVPIQEITDKVTILNGSLKEYVYGVSSFLNQPFSLVQNLALSIGDVLKTVGSLANIPHEMMRSWREMICAIKALPESIFKGYTNPNLFDGTSNCGTSLGVVETPLINYDNSFEATAQLPPERTASQQFLVPQETLVLKEAPTKITGVYLATDVSRTGTNYLQSYDTNKITLTSVPNSPVMVDYVVKQTSEIDMLRLQQARSMVVKVDHTLERISEEAYGDASKWKIIALFNELEYPFLVPSGTETEFRATGFVTFTRDIAYTHSITIPAGYPVYTPYYRGTNRIDFRTTQDATLNMSVSTISVPVEAVLPGETGNVSTGVINQFGVSYSASTVSVNATLKHFIDSAGGFTTSRGFAIGNKFITTGFSKVANNGTWTIVDRTNFYIRVLEGGMVSETPGKITVVSVGNGGSGYSVGDVLSIGGGTGGTATVLTAPGTVVTTVALTSGGFGYSPGLKLTTVTPTGGTGCTLIVSAIESPSSSTTFRVVGLKSVTNPSATTGGSILNVMQPGDLIQIPDEVGQTTNIISKAESYEELFGKDVYIDPKTGEFDVSNESYIDLKQTVGTKNLVQALRNRIVTSKGYYAYYPEYGSDLPYYVGRKNIDYWQNLAAVESKASCLFDPRISSVSSFRLIANGDFISIELDAIPINEQSSLKLNLIV